MGAPIKTFEVNTVHQFRKRALVVAPAEDPSKVLYGIRVGPLLGCKGDTIKVYDTKGSSEIDETTTPIGYVKCNNHSYPSEVIIGSLDDPEDSLVVPMDHKFDIKRTVYTGSVPLADSEKQIELKWKGTKDVQGFKSKMSLGLHFKLVDADNRMLARFVHKSYCSNVAGTFEIYEDVNVKDWELFALMSLLGAVDHAVRVMYLATYITVAS